MIVILFLHQHNLCNTTSAWIVIDYVFLRSGVLIPVAAYRYSFFLFHNSSRNLITLTIFLSGRRIDRSSAYRYRFKFIFSIRIFVTCYCYVFDISILIENFSIFFCDYKVLYLLFRPLPHSFFLIFFLFQLGHLSKVKI